ncbi:MAG: hypothetical protein JSU66_12750 [Deltaproteobacteria bacterium]|nr:MAG: hypothetical protein JSU66_12750 [Deltaproteobacteria bacterium]
MTRSRTVKVKGKLVNGVGEVCPGGSTATATVSLEVVTDQVPRTQSFTKAGVVYTTAGKGVTELFNVVFTREADCTEVPTNNGSVTYTASASSADILGGPESATISKVKTLKCQE